MNYTLEELNKMMKANGGSLDLEGCTGLTQLPEGLTVGGSLYLRGCTGLTQLPEGLTVGGSLYLRGCTGIKNRNDYKKLKNGDYVQNKYFYCDGILTHVKRRKKIGKYLYYVGKIKGKNVISEGTYFAHCESFKDGIADLEFKAAKDRGSEQYKNLTLDSIVKSEDAKTMYRIITGACRAGTQQFVDSLGEIKETYTIREIIEMTKGHFGATTFEKFFKEK